MDKFKLFTVSNILISVAFLLVLFSLVLPIYLYGAGLVCKSQVEKSGIDKANCATPIMSYQYGTEEHKAFTNEYKYLINDYFGRKMPLTTAFLIFYIVGLVGAAFFIFTGNPFDHTWRVFAGIGLVFADTIYVVMAFTFFLQDLVEMDGTFMLNSLLTIFAVAGFAIYLVVFYRFYRRHQISMKLSDSLNDEFSIVYPAGIPRDVEETRLNASNNLTLTANYLNKNALALYVIQETVSNVERDLNKIENDALELVLMDISQTSSHILNALGSAFDSTHVEEEQVERVFYRLVGTSNHKSLSEHIDNYRLQT